MVCLYTLASLNFTLSVSEFMTTNVVKLSLFQENNLSSSILHRVKYWCRKRGCKRCNRTPRSFELVKIRAKSTKIRAKCEEIWEKYVQTSAKLLYVCLFCKNGTQNESEDVFVGGHFLSKFFRASLRKFGQKFFATPKICVLLHLGITCRTELNHLSLSPET